MSDLKASDWNIVILKYLWYNDGDKYLLVERFNYG